MAQLDLELGVYFQFVVIRKLFEKCLQGELGIGPEEFATNPECHEKIKIYMKDIILDCIIEFKGGFMGVASFAEAYENCVNEAMAALKNAQKEKECKNEHGN